MKNFKPIFFILLFLFFLSPIVAFAFTAEKGTSIYVGETKTIEGNYFVAAANITIDGHITGDIFCAAQSVVINGTVDGDVICVGQSISVNGKVGGSLRTAASDINIRGTIDRGVSLAAANVNIEKSGKIGWDALIAAANAQIRGELGRSLHGAGANYTLGGKIVGDVDIYLDNNQKTTSNELVVGETAEIGGKLNYMSKTDAKISEQAQIAGEVIHKAFPVKRERKAAKGGYATLMFIAMLSALIVGTVLVKLWRAPILEITENMLKKFWPTLGWGFVLTIITPIAAFLIAITIIGARLALIIFSVWMLMMMFSKIMAAIAFGVWLVRNYWSAKKDSLITAMVLGIIISWLIFYIPFFGFIVSAIALWWGMGGLLVYLKKRYEK
ncbi:MAG: hypothetical protein US83_C0006G0023 [Candidatus Falkowbacteria bacterium GW2011_GWC2_38_22]|uniref:DUF8173 domain-containing protein n=1 Tax=Candidatus Falkowbacteria bacterium GW2011_GWE1_38_31 TaxID=1618638 RepID=A0A0G0MBM8_9BACT|nr:MAG: hypothetical protein US73_C0001G0066 [Candidatus Falkowbacteria bacterium GW2011_GWF2_38_1205]KKQ61383.1 MAG: hypothetical protein US83_C0006G0023 [Candidatus Falkowbacteria bacterium GW2011_GWC2_38_22]KKQ64034.1 MAG: hypothetical protein US84_C0002G0066 [Candidatus Falkowbacteria bacterium GW2011_GWF1_38_22]KKQ66618.1 MAG: hypothetical protein US87_C0001G0139 [Candidatus Falkowbacteria bacterium GW2011_GWE2_38_254]KKQ71139.1 MAG: hypothetical protein US91_C0001G0066 [Candidatus Falkowb